MAIRLLSLALIAAQQRQATTNNPDMSLKMQVVFLT